MPTRNDNSISRGLYRVVAWMNSRNARIIVAVSLVALASVGCGGDDGGGGY